MRPSVRRPFSNRKCLPPPLRRKAAAYSSSSSQSGSDDDDQAANAALQMKLVHAVRERKSLLVVRSLLAEARSIDVAAVRDCPEKGNTLLHLVLSKKIGSKGDAFASQAAHITSMLDCLLQRCGEVVNAANKKCPANSGGGDSPLTIAADDGLLGACDLLLANGANANFRVCNGVPDGHLLTPLLYAAKNAALNSGIRDQSALCRLLLQYDADPNARDAKGFSPLMWTAPDARTPSGQVEFARELLTWGAAVDAQDNEGFTALWWACHFCEEQCRKNPAGVLVCRPYILLLLARGADADLAPSNGAVSSSRQMLVRCSLQQMLEPIEPEIVTISDDEQVDAASQPAGGAAADGDIGLKRSVSHEEVSFPATRTRKRADAAAEHTDPLQLQKKNLQARRNSLQEQLKEAERELSSVREEILRQSNLTSIQPLVVVKAEPEDGSSGSAGDDEIDRWANVHACGKCSGQAQWGETMICCEYPACTNIFHLQCVLLSAVPEGTWICDDHVPKKALLPRDATSALKALLFKPVMSNEHTVWPQQRCFAENKIFVLDAADERFLREIRARLSADPVIPEIRIVKGLPFGIDTATQRKVNQVLSTAFADPNSLSSQTRVVVRTISDTDPRVGLRGQSGVFAAQDIAKFTVLEAYRGRLRLKRRADEACSVMDKYLRGIFEYEISRDSWCDSKEKPRWWLELRHDLKIDPVQAAEGGAGFGNEFMLMNDFRDKDPIQLFGPHRLAPRSKSIKGGNTCWMHVEHMGWPHVFIIAREDISAGTELTIDYGEGYWTTQALEQSVYGMTVRAHEEANLLLIAPGCPDEPIVL